MYVSENRDTGFVTVVVKHKSPVVAKEFSEIIINELNKFYRSKDKESASHNGLSKLSDGSNVFIGG